MRGHTDVVYDVAVNKTGNLLGCYINDILKYKIQYRALLIYL